MKIFTHLSTLFLSLCIISHCSTASLPASPQHYVPFNSLPAEQIDMATIMLLKADFETAKKVLIQIRDSQNPSVIKSGVSVLGTTIKEIVYILASVFFGGGSVILATGTLVGPRGLDRLMENPLVIAGSCIVFPITIISSYILLKLIFGRLLASSNPNVIGKNIQEALTLIDQTLNKLDYEIRKIEHLLQYQKTTLN